VNAEASDTVAWRALHTETVDRFVRAGFATAEIDARRIVEEAAGIEPARFAIDLDEPATVRGVARLDAMVARRLTGEPLQYVVGRWGFRSLDLAVDRRALIPRPETEMVAGLVVAEASRRTAAGAASVTVVDLGTGSGAIGLAVAQECPRAHVVATDRSREALALARANLIGLGRAATRVRLEAGSWFDAVPADLAGSIDVLVSNPPYVADGDELPAVVREWEPVEALRSGPDGLDDLVRIIDGSGPWLADDGLIVLEMAPGQTSAMADRLRAQGLRVEIHDDLAGRPRAVSGRRV